MKEQEKEFYKNLLQRREVDDARRFGWTSNHTQATRFIQIIKLVRQISLARQRDPATVSILDFGCGDGRLFSLMHKFGVGSQYYGIDGMEEHLDVAFARAEQENLPAEYTLLGWDGAAPFPYVDEVDFVVENGAFSTTDPQTRSIMLKKLFDMPKLGFVGTFVTDSKIIKGVNPAIHLIKPEDIVKEIDGTVYAFVVWADYLEADFAVGVYKR